jgi:two-component system, chemotaxis family, CheB/CheR fusion protein
MKKITTKKENPVSKPVKKQISKPINFPIVGIGASAGGLEALEQFFGGVPRNSGLAYVVIQHLDPNHVGIMPELLQRTTTMKVFQATDYVQIKPNQVYVIPPNKSMSVLNGHLHLFAPIESRGLRLPVDYFFRSLADDQQEKSIGIILSGMGSDGSLGLKAIKEKNGIVLVQDPQTAKFDGMPKSAPNEVSVDIMDGANELPGRLVAFLKINKITLSKTGINDKSKNNLEKIILLLRTQTGHDFSMYKNNTMYRRIERRMNVHQIDKIAAYVRFLQENPEELEILFKELLIGVTNFFRDQALWKKLKDKVLPELFKSLPNGHVIRAWVTACSTGEEVYSLAIIFQEAYEKVKKEKNLTLQIFATDIDSDAIEKARKGFFNQNIIADVSPERLSTYFNKEETGFRINTSIREMIVFAPHNVIKDPPFTKLELLFCRNLLIYMEPELQKKLMNLFHYSLNPGGVMVLGTAENENSQNNLFIPIDAKLKIYKRLAIPVNKELLDFPDSLSHSTKKTVSDIQAVKVTENIQTLADQLLLQHFAPASVLINSEGDILYISGRTGKYLEPAAGKANLNIYAMAREGLNNELPGAIRKAKQNYNPLSLTNLKIGTNGGTQIVNVTIQVVEKPAAIKGTIMIVFTDVAGIQKRILEKPKKGTENATNREQELAIELQRANEDLQSTREEMQTTQEELKSTNEEMQSTNEELQSTNEELTTSKEEMQSLNEELQTVNLELQSKVTDYIVAENDMKNLLNSTGVATLFIDKRLNIRRYTEPLSKIFKIRQTDVGRPFTDLVSNLNYPEMKKDALEVIRTLVFKEVAITTHDKTWFTVRIIPYRTLDDRIDGLVITFIDFTEAKNLEAKQNKTEKIIEEGEKNYRELLTLLEVGVVVHAADTSIIMNNPKAEELLGLNERQMKGIIAADSKWRFLDENNKPLKLEEYPVNKILKDGKPIKNYTMGIKRPTTNDTIRVSVNGSPIFDDNGKLFKIVISFIDITAKKET